MHTHIVRRPRSTILFLVCSDVFSPSCSDGLFYRRSRHVSAARSLTRTTPTRTIRVGGTFNSTGSSCKCPAHGIKSSCFDHIVPFHSVFPLLLLIFDSGVSFTAIELSRQRRRRRRSTSLVVFCWSSFCRKSWGFFFQRNLHTPHNVRLHNSSLNSHSACQLRKRAAVRQV